MYFSITFGTEPDLRNTWEDWKLIPAAPPTVDPPEPILNYVDIPGRRLGPIDLSTYPFGKILYKPVSGVWSFLTEPHGHHERVVKSDAIRKWLHGRVTTIRLEEDPEHYYRGRLTVGPMATGQGPNQIDIEYTLEPIRYNVKDNTEDTTWVTEWTT